jgi:hypothetical protein
VIKLLFPAGMSLSKEQRYENMETALRLVFEALGSQAIRTYFIDPASGRYTNLPATTWLDLKEKAFIRDSQVPPHYRLTGHGWMKCLEITGALASLEFKETLGKLCSTLKSAVNGRREPALVGVSDIARGTGIDEGTVWNIIDADVIDYHLNRHGADWLPGAECMTIKVPANFGHERI